jgi:Cyclin, N-terminal domain/Cyclin, C-terminal domain
MAAESASHSARCGSNIVNQLCCDVPPGSVWRQKVSQWCYDVADHLNEDRSLVYVAMYILDRYCTSLTSRIHEKSYEMASLSSIFLAVHVAGSGDLTLSDLVSMSRGGITENDIRKEASVIATAISLREPIATPAQYLRSVVHQISKTTTFEQSETVIESASYMVELAVCDMYFSQCKASSIALAAILNALETVVLPNAKQVAQMLMKDLLTDVDSTDNIVLLRTRLSCIYNCSVEHLQGSDGPHVIEDDDDMDEYPRYTTSNMKKGGLDVVISDDASIHLEGSKMDE